MRRTKAISIIPDSFTGRKSARQEEIHRIQMQRFADHIRQLESTIDFPVSARGWCYILEGQGHINKDDFNRAQTVINDCRKTGLLPLGICAVDEARSTEGITDSDRDWSPNEYADFKIDRIKSQIDTILSDVAYLYNPLHFFDTQMYYVEVAVEKIDLIGLFKPVCQKYSTPLTNFVGYSDLNSRAAMIERFKFWEAQGAHCVLLYCGDLDPGGVLISDFLRKNINDLSAVTGWTADDLIIDRFGLNYDFIEENELMWIDNLITSGGKDPMRPTNGKAVAQNIIDYVDQYGERKCEANALVIAPEMGRKLLEDAILKYITPEAIEEFETTTQEKREEAERIILDYFEDYDFNINR